MSAELVVAAPAQGAALVTRDSAADRLVSWAEAAHAAHTLAVSLTATTFVPQHFQGKPGDATAAILLGAEVGLTPISALQAIYVISGKPAMYAKSMVALVQAAGHEVWVEDETDKAVTVVGQRRGSTREHRSTWTVERARLAGYTSNKKYQTDPQAMLWARAASDVCRRMAPDVLAGLAYSVEELDDTPGRAVKVSRASAKANAPEPADPDASVQGITDAQSKKLHALVNEAGLDRDGKLALASSVVGRDVESTNDLSKVEAARVIDALEAPPAEPAEVPPPTEAGPELRSATTQQKRALNAQVKRLSLDADTYLEAATVAAGRTITATADLTEVEAGVLLEDLGSQPDPGEPGAASAQAAVRAAREAEESLVQRAEFEGEALL